MEDRQSIPQIINAFRTILEDIFQVSMRDDYINKIFSNEYKDEINKKIDHYFENEINDLYNPKDLYTMKDGVKYLLEKIRNSSRVMKILFYMTLFHKDEIILENEISDILDRIL
ncbi:MAG: hypothetical protein EU541_08490 [Promethearchaeota archaeon]|nr:MAG: hypothetical protein EU541_08490 [Candidatus Lokiarchaeota archaeon]